MVYRTTGNAVAETDIKFFIQGRTDSNFGYAAATYSAASYGIEIVTNPNLQVSDTSVTRNGTDCTA